MKKINKKNPVTVCIESNNTYPRLITAKFISYSDVVSFFVKRGYTKANIERWIKDYKNSHKFYEYNKYDKQSFNEQAKVVIKANSQWYGYNNIFIEDPIKIVDSFGTKINFYSTVLNDITKRSSIEKDTQPFYDMYRVRVRYCKNR
jgi:hypothetical protein